MFVYLKMLQIVNDAFLDPSQGLAERMIVFISKDGAAPQQLIVTSRTKLAVVQAMLRMPSDPGAPCAWKLDDDTWALADTEARLIDIADDLRGTGASPNAPLCVRSPPGYRPAEGALLRVDSHACKRRSAGA